MRNTILGGLLLAQFATAASADNSNFERFLGGVIVGAVIVDALRAPTPVYHPPVVYPTAPVYHPPVVYHTAHPLRVCVEEIERGPGWAYLYQYNCSGELLAVIRLR